MSIAHPSGRIVAPTLAVAAALAMTACAPTPDAPAPSPTEQVSTSGTTESSAPAPSPSADASTPTTPSAASTTSDGEPADVDTSAPADVAANPVTAALWDALMHADGEYAAAAMYSAVIDKHGDVEPYVSIKAAEERHIQALIRQLNRRGIDVPENPYLGKVDAPDDLTDAARAWADGEVANIELYDSLAGKVESDPQAQRVFGNLRRASEEMHLPMFELAAEHGGTLTKEQMLEFSPRRR